MNNLEQMKKRRNKISAIIAILIVLNLLLVFLFATTNGEPETEDTINLLNSGTGEGEPAQEPAPAIVGNKSIADVATGANFTVALDSSGNVYAWGQNERGQLGNGTLNSSISKQPVLKADGNPLTNVKQIAVGEYHAAALTNNNEVYIWGYNYFGQTGREDIKRLEYATKLDTNGYTIKEIACGADFTLALTNDGNVLGLGDSTNGQLGYYNTLQFTSLREIEEQKGTETLPSISHISAGNRHVIAVDNSGKVWTWGNKTAGTSFDFSTIKEVTGISGTASQIQAGNDVSMTVDSNGQVYTWDLDSESSLRTINLSSCVNKENGSVNVQVRAENSIAIVNKTYYIIDTNNNVYAWGQNTAGQVGHGTTTSSVSSPTQLKTSYDMNITGAAEINDNIDKIASSSVAGTGKNSSGTEVPSTNGSYDTAYAINEKGYVLGWGYAGEDITEKPMGTQNTFKLLGDGTRNYAEYIGSISVKATACDDIVLNVNQTKNLGNELTDKITGGLVNLYEDPNTVSPSKLESLKIEMLNPDIATYENGIVKGVAQGKTVLKVGSAKNTIYINVIVKDSSSYTFAKMESGRDFTIALKTDGTVWGWGNNGNVGLNNAFMPIQVKFDTTRIPALAKVKDIAVGDNFVIVIADDNTVWGWGYNGSGQLGNGTRTNVNANILNDIVEPVQVQMYQLDNDTQQPVNNVFLGNIKSISAGQNYALALSNDGKVYGWGYNNYGQIGNGTTSTYETRAKETNLTNIVDRNGNAEEIKQIETGRYTSYIVTKSGNLYAFGSNNNYQFGATSPSYSYVPVQIITSYANKVTKVISGMNSDYAYAMTVDGKVYMLSGYYGYPYQVLQDVVDIEDTYGSYSGIAKFANGRVGYWTSANIRYNNKTTNNYVTFLSNSENTMSISGGYDFYTVVKTDGSVWSANQSSGSKAQLGNRNVSVNANTLNQISEEYITLDKHEETINKGDSFEINAKKVFEFSLYKGTEEAINVANMTYTTLDSTIATVSANSVTGIKSGKTYVIATYTDPDTNEQTKLRVEVNVLDNTIGETAMPDTSAGYNHTVALKANGKVYGLGYSSYGELGTTGSISEPTYLGIDGVKDVEAGYCYTLMLMNDGTVKAMGYNGYGQLGNNTTTSSTVPVYVVDQDGNNLTGISKIIALYNTSLALDKDGNMYAWGQNETRYARKVNTYGLKVKDISGRLILTEDGRVWEYTSADSIKYRPELSNIVQISSSAYSNSTSYGYYMALDANGNVYTWVKYSSDRVLSTDTTTPTQIPFAEGVQIVDIEAGVNVAYARDKNGFVYSWGNYNVGSGTLGIGSNSASQPTLINELSNIESMSASKCTTTNRRAYAVTTSGAVYGFGANGSYALLGNGDTDVYTEPRMVGESYAGFVDSLGNELTRLSIEKGATKDVIATLMDSFSLRLSSATSATTDFEWAVLGDLVTLSGTDTKTITAGNTLGEATVVATDSATGKVAKLFIDVVEPQTQVAPKVETVGDHTVALKADGTVWTWGTKSYTLGIVNGNGVNQTSVNEPQQVLVAKEVRVPTALRTDDIIDPNTNEVTGTVQVFSNGDGNEYYAKGNDFVDANGNIAIKYNSTYNKYYAWDSENNNFVGADIVFVDIAVSNRHTLLLTKDGDVYSYGYNGNGQLGYSTPTSYGFIPQKVATLSNIVKIAAGENYSIALDKYGKLYTAGYASHFHINNDNRCHEPINWSYFKKMKEIDYVNIEQFAKDAVDITNEYILTKDGKVIALRLYSTTLATGTEVPGITGKVVKITRTSGTRNDGHTAFVTDVGTSYTIGKGDKGQLGNGSNPTQVTTAVQVLNESGSTLTNIRDIYVGENHTIAIDKTGNAYTWGGNERDQLRNTQSHLGLSIPRAYPCLTDSKISKVIAVSAGNAQTVVVDQSGYVYAWGAGTSGQLGNGINADRKDAVRVGTEGITLSTNSVTLQEGKDSIIVNAHDNQLNLIYDKITRINSASSTDSSVATAVKKTDDSVEIDDVKAGTTSVVVTSALDGNTYNSIIQVTVLPGEAELNVNVPANKTIKPMTVSGKSHTLVLKSDGTVFAYGDNTYGQTTARTNYSDRATQVDFTGITTSPIISVGAGDNFSVALDEDGNVYTWGRIDSISSSSVPVKVSNISNIVKISAGANQILAIDANGYVYSWGKNINGSLGIGSTSNVSTPTKINNIARAIDVAVGNDHAMILTADGKVYTTGRNTAGQLGISSTVISKDVFTAIEISEPIEYISAGNRTSMAISTSGNLYVWGYNGDGQLGLNSANTRVYQPTYVNSVSNVQSISAGDNHTQIVTISGEIYSAGSNNYGQLGVGKGTEKSDTFVKIDSLGNKVMSSNAGQGYSTVIEKDGTVYGFGDYNHGNINRTSLTNSDVPVMISDNVAYLNEQEIVVFEEGEYTINPNGRYKLNVLHKDNSEFEYETTNAEIADVDAEGKVTGIATGTTTIKVIEKDSRGIATGNVSTVIVKVVPKGETTSTAIAPAVEGGDGFAVTTNKDGTLNIYGSKDFVKSDIPTVKNDNLHFTSIKAGKDFVVGINSDGTVWVLGDNSKGQAGVGLNETYYNYMNRVNAYGVQNAVQVDAGDSHVIALDELGTAYVWGDNSKGQLGISSATTIVDKPTVVRPAGSRVISVSAGGDYSSIVTTNGDLYILRNSTSSKVNLPGKAVKAVTGKYETIALMNDGTVCKVSNSAVGIVGQMSLNNIVDIATNADTFMCLTKDQELYTFGNNDNGKMGVGTQGGTISSPRRVAEDIFTMGGAYNNTYYINTKGEVFAAGSNTRGELGNGTSNKANTTTGVRSTTYTKVGDISMEFVPKTVRVAPTWKVLVGDDSLESDITNKIKAILINNKNEFNVFGNKVVNLSDYEFTMGDTTIAEITDPDILEITAKELGETALTAKHKVTNDERELKIYVVPEAALRIDDVYVTDPSKFDSEVEGESKFLIDIEGSASTGILHLELLYNDNITSITKDGTPLTGYSRVGDTLEWTLPVNLTEPYQELTITLNDGTNDYTFTIVIYKSTIVQVNNEVLTSAKEKNEATGKMEEVYNKFINPVDTQAEIKIKLGNTSNKTIELFESDERGTKGNEITLIEVDNTWTVTVSVPDLVNRFILKTTDEYGYEEEYVIKIQKSSIEYVSIPNGGHTIKDYGTEGTGNYVKEFNTTINDKPETRKVTIQLSNPKVTAVEVTQDGTTLPTTLNTTNATVDIELPDENDSDTMELIIVVTTSDGYTEEYKLTIKTISSNNGIEKFVLSVSRGSQPKYNTSTKVNEEGTEHELILHDVNINLDTIINMGIYTESGKAQISYDKSNYEDVDNNKFIEKSVQLVKQNDNEYTLEVNVKSENGDIKTHVLHVYKESEHAEMDSIEITTDKDTQDERTETAEQVEGTNIFKGKVLKNKDNYVIEINVIDEFADITSISTEDSTTITKVSGKPSTLTEDGTNGKFVFTTTNDILGKEITIVVKPEYSGASEQTYTLTINEMDDNANIDRIFLDRNSILSIADANGVMRKNIKKTDNGWLTVEAESEVATIEIKLNDSVIASSTGKLEDIPLPIDEGETKTFEIIVTSEDGMNTVTKTLIVKRKSNNADITSIEAIVSGVTVATATVDENDSTIWNIDISETITNPVIKVTPADTFATVTVDENNNNTAVDISNRNSIDISVTAEDESETKDYTLNINKLSSNVDITKEIKDERENQIKANADFTGTSPSYTVTLKNNSGNNALAITPTDSDAKVEMKFNTDSVYTETNSLTFDTVSAKVINVKVTAADGITEKVYTITINLEDPILKALKVNDIERTVQSGIAEARVNPNDTTATVRIDTNYSSTVVMKYDSGVRDAEGNIIYTTIKSNTGSINLLSGGEGTITEVEITLTATGKEDEIIMLSIVKGSTNVELDKVEFKGITQENVTNGNAVTATPDYTNPTVTLINDTDTAHKYTVKATATDSATVKVYKVTDLTTDIDSITLTNTSICTEITENAQVQLNGNTNTRFIIEVTSEYGNNKERYEVFVKEANSSASLNNLEIKLSNNNGDTLTKNLTDFGTFEHNNDTNYEEIEIILPSELSNMEVGNLSYADFATVQWTDIGSTTLVDYDSSVKQSDSSPNGKTMLIKVTAENGTEKTYCLKFVKDTDTSLKSNPVLENVDQHASVTVTGPNGNQYTSDAISDTISRVKVTASSDGNATLKVTKVNGKEISDEINSATNELQFNIKRDYTEEGTSANIAEKDAKTVVVEIAVKSQSDKFYEGTPFDSENVAKYELTIIRSLSNTDMSITLKNSTGTTTIPSSEFTSKPNEDGKAVYEYEYLVPSDTTTLDITKIKADNENSTLKHNNKTGKPEITYTDGEYTITLPSVDKASITERIELTSDSGNTVIYKLKVRKQSAITEITNIKLNGYETDKVANSDTEYTGLMLLPINKLELEVTGLEEHATVKAQIINIDGNPVTRTEATLSGSGTSRKANIVNQLGVANPQQITVKLTVVAEDTNIATEYTLLINVQQAILESIDGLDTTGTVDTSAQLSMENGDFDGAQGTYTAVRTDNGNKIKEIILQSAVNSIELTNIKYTCEEDVTITALTNNITLNDNNNDGKIDGFTITGITDNAETTTATFKLEAGGYSQNYTIIVRNKSTDTSIKSISETNGKSSNTLTLATKATVDPEITVELNGINAKVTGAVYNGTPLTVTNNKFRVTGIAETHNSSDVQNTAIVTVTVQAEDGTTQDYDIQLERKHEETSLPYVEYSVGAETKELLKDTNRNMVENIIPSTESGIYITNILPTCSYATVKVNGEDFDADRLYEIAEGETKKFTITVTAEYGNKEEFKYEVKRQSANTDVSIKINDKETSAIEGIYKANIKVDTDMSTIEIVPNAGQTIVGTPNVTGVKDANALTVSSNNNSINISGLVNACEYVDDNSEHPDQCRVITITFTVAAEDTRFTKAYTVELTRQHIETGIPEVAYTYTTDGNASSGTIDTLTPTAPSASIEVEADVEQVDFAKIIPNCDKATVEIKVANEVTEQTGSGFTVTLPETTPGDGCVKTVKVTVTAESGDKQVYTIEITRLALNAKLNIVKVNNEEIECQDSTDPSIEGTYEATIRDSATTATIYAKSAHRYATIRLKNSAGTVLASGIQAINDYTYTLTDADRNARNIEFTVEVEAQNGDIKTYALTIIREYADPNLQSISIKPADSTGLTGAIVLEGEDFTKITCPHTYYYTIGKWPNASIGSYTTYDYWYKLNNNNPKVTRVGEIYKIIIPTGWDEIVIGDLLPEAPSLTAKVTRITCADPSDPNPNHASGHADGVIDFANSTFVMPEGEYVYFKVETTPESGDKGNTYGLVLYKEATNTNVTIKVDGNDKINTEGTPKYNVKTSNNSISIVLTGENKLSERSNITSIKSNGVDITSSIGITESISENKKIITYTLDISSITDKVLDVSIDVSPEDANITPKEYNLTIIRQDESADIASVAEIDVTGVNPDIDIPVDTVLSHYTDIGKQFVDNSIYTHYIDSDKTSVDVKVTPVSNYAKIKLSSTKPDNWDEVELAGTGSATTTVTIPSDATRTRLFVQVTSEDGLAKKEYQLWFIKKSSDISIEELIIKDIDGRTNNMPEIIKVSVDPNDLSKDYYEVDIEDSKTSVTLQMTSAYEYADVGIGGQALKVHTTTVTIPNLKTAEVDPVTGKIKVELKLIIIKEASATGERIEVNRYLYINRVSKDNGIESITTENNNDKTVGPYSLNGYRDAYDIYLDATGSVRDSVELTIVPLSPKAKVELYDTEGRLLAEEDGLGFLQSDTLTLELDTETGEIKDTTYKVKVIPQIGDEKEYTIVVRPKSSQAELIHLKVGNASGTLIDKVEEEGLKYEYLVPNLMGTDGVVEAEASDNTCHIEIYGSYNQSTKVEGDGIARLEDIDLDNTTYISVAVTSPNGAHTSTYTLWLKDVSNDTTLNKVAYSTDINPRLTTVQSKTTTLEGYAGEYAIAVNPEENELNLTLKANNELSTVELRYSDDNKVGGTTQTLEESIDISSMTEDIVLDIVVTAESGNTGKYKLTIKKKTIITGKVTTKDNMSGVEVSLEDSEAKVITATTNQDGIFEVEAVPSETYKMTIEKDGYLKYEMTGIPATYGIRRYTGIAELLAGDIDNSGAIDLLDLSTVKKLARQNISASATETPYYDFNGDGTIDDKDVEVVRYNYNKKFQTKEYSRVVEIIGELLDDKDEILNKETMIQIVKDDVVVNDALDRTTGEFDLINAEMGTYTIIVKDFEGKVYGTNTITIEEGSRDNVSAGTITVKPNTSLVNLTIRVNGDKAVIAKRGEPSDDDITKPTTTFEATVIDGGIELEAEAKDDNLSTISFYRVTKVDDEEIKELIKTITVGEGVTEYEARETYRISTEFGDEFELYVEVSDSRGNITKVEKKVTNNIIKSAEDIDKLNASILAGTSYAGQTITLNEDITITQPIGKNATTTKAFDGTFDGNGHVITLNINSTNAYAGLFAKLNGATIKNLGIEGTITSGGAYLGSIAGKTDGNTVIENCYNKAVITGNGNYVGGFIGYASTITISNSYNTADVTGTKNSIGGFIGYAASADTNITNCYNAGSVTGVNNVGELIGWATATKDATNDTISTATLNNCYTALGNAVGKHTNVTSSIDAENEKLNYTTALISGITASSLGAEFEEDSDSINNGLPILKWEIPQVSGYSMRPTDEDMILPISTNYTITSGFGTRTNPTTGEPGSMHYGIDIAAEWQTPILAVADGTVTFAGENGGYGYCVEIEHNINGEKIYTVYGHLSRIDVSVGDTVEQGDQIGLEGGRPGDVGSGTSTGAHLHFEIRTVSGSYLSAVNPRNYLEFKK